MKLHLIRKHEKFRVELVNIQQKSSLHYLESGSMQDRSASHISPHVRSFQLLILISHRVDYGKIVFVLIARKLMQNCLSSQLQLHISSKIYSIAFTLILFEADIFSLREKCPYLDFLQSVFSHIRTEYGEILRISPYLVQMGKSTDQKNPEH